MRTTEQLEWEAHQVASEISGCECECDPSVGINSCVYCAATQQVLKLIVQRETARDDADKLGELCRIANDELKSREVEWPEREVDLMIVSDSEGPICLVEEIEK